MRCSIQAEKYNQEKRKRDKIHKASKKNLKKLGCKKKKKAKNQYGLVEEIIK